MRFGPGTAGLPAKLLAICSLILFAPSSPCFGISPQSRSQGALRDEEAAHHYQKWLKEDVVYIITPEEERVFKSLNRDAERENFIEQFWRRRDPTAGDGQNEFKEEHYRRIAYANEHFAAGIPGWRTDRGRIYIMYGPPDQLEKHPGGTYQREPWEGDGKAIVHPFERWRYRYIEGIGLDLEIEFVDHSMTGSYELVMGSAQKEIAGFDQGRRPLGLSQEEERQFFLRERNQAFDPFYTRRYKDLPFEQLERFFNLQKPPSIKFTDLKTTVESRITYDQLPFSFTSHVIYLSSEIALVPVTLVVDDAQLEYQQTGSVWRAEVEVYGSIQGLSGRQVAEFEDIIHSDSTRPPAEIASGRSTYQKMVGLAPGLYKISLVLRDRNSGQIGTRTSNLNVPSLETSTLEASSLILAEKVQRLREVSEAAEPFNLGDWKVVPSVEGVFKAGDLVGVYLQIYNAGIDQATRNPALSITYVLKKGGEEINRWEDTAGTTQVFTSKRRIVLLRIVKLDGLERGNYTIEVQVKDLTTKQTVARSSRLTITNALDPVTPGQSHDRQGAARDETFLACFCSCRSLTVAALSWWPGLAGERVLSENLTELDASVLA